jgi:hypothetical protein
MEKEECKDGDTQSNWERRGVPYILLHTRRREGDQLHGGGGGGTEIFPSTIEEGKEMSSIFADRPRNTSPNAGGGR